MRFPFPCQFVLACAVVTLVSLNASSAKAEGKWESVGLQEGVQVSRMQVEGSGAMAFRGEVVADVDIARIVAVFVEPKERPHWVDRYHSHKTVERGERHEIYRIRFGLSFPVTDRDYVLDSRVEVDEPKRVFVTRIKSITDARAPVDDCCVRAQTHNTFYRFEALPGGKTRMQVEVHTDPKGLLPKWLVNRIQKGWPSKTLNGLVARARRPEVKPHPRFAAWASP